MCYLCSEVLQYGLFVNVIVDTIRPTWTGISLRQRKRRGSAHTGVLLY